MKPFHSRTKIVATLGPASAKPDVLYSMFNAGLDVCRLNFSHGSQADHQEVLDTIRSINKKYKYPFWNKQPYIKCSRQHRRHHHW